MPHKESILATNVTEEEIRQKFAALTFDGYTITSEGDGAFRIEVNPDIEESRVPGLIALAFKLLAKDEEATPFYQVGNPHPRWYDKNGKRLPAYESLMLTAGYAAELPYEQGR